MVHDQLAVHALKCKAYANAVMQKLTSVID